VELLKGSLQTFLNAFTYPDRTCYPVASCNLKDFYNLANVYLDAVLHPRAIKVYYIRGCQVKKGASRCAGRQGLQLRWRVIVVASVGLYLFTELRVGS